VSGLRVGCVGTGFMAGRHLEALSRLPGVEVAASPDGAGDVPAAAICRLNVQLDIYDATALTDARAAREACLRAIVNDLATAGGHRLVLEQDDSLVKHDQAVLFRAVRDVGVTDTLTYEHLPARTEPLLWIADAAAWCWTHGRHWQDRVAPVVRSVTRL
jgi:hypothetical protein